MKNKRILLISLQGIGDLLMVTPLAKLLKESLPKAYIAVLTLDTNAQVLKNNPHVDKVLTVKEGALFESVKLLFIIKKEKFDTAISTYPSGIRSAMVAYLSGIPNRFAHNLAIYKKCRFLFSEMIDLKCIKHAVLLNLDFISLFKIEFKKIDNDMVFNLSDEDKKEAQKIYRKYSLIDKTNITIHVGGGKYAKLYRSWPLEKYAQLCDELAKIDQVKIIFVGGEEDKSATDKVLSLMTYPAVNLVVRLTLPLTAAVIEKSKIFIGNNSAPMHLAAALKVPTVTIFGCVDKRLHHPWGNEYVILQKDMDCCPCYYPFITGTLKETAERNRWINKKFICVKGSYPCFNDLEVGDFLKEVERKIGNVKK